MKKYRSTCGSSVHSGFSLVEAMVALSLIAVLATSTISGVLFTRQLAESNIYQNTALTVSYGYMEQMQAITYTELKNAAQAYNTSPSGVASLDPSDNTDMTSTLASSIRIDTKSIDSTSVGIGSNTNLEIDSPLYVGMWLDRDVLIDIQDPEGVAKELRMKMRFKVEINDLEDSSDLEALEIKLSYEYQGKIKAGNKWFSGEIRMVRSSAPSFI